MSRSPSSSLWKLSGMTFGCIALAMLLVWVSTSWTLRHFFDEIGRAVIEDDLREYGLIYERRGAEAVRSLFVSVDHEDHEQALRLLDPSGETRIDLPIPGRPGEMWPKFPGPVSPGVDGIEWLRHPLFRGTVLTVGRRRFDDGAEMWFARTNAADLEAIRQVHDLLLVAMVVSGILACGPVVWFASRVLRPVQALISGANRLASGDSLDLRLETSTAIPELRIFAEAFNASLERIQKLTEELEAANDQLAHELRTPLARIRGNIERILVQPEAGPEILESAARAVDEIGRAADLIQRILSIRAGDSGSLRLNLEVLSLANLLGETFELYSAAAEEKGVHFRLALPENERPLSLDRQRVQQALCNLLDNAIAYTPAGGMVEAELRFEEGAAVVHVRDSGPGLSDADFDTVWERFRRGSAASAGEPGIGLGLSLVRAVAKAHRGNVDVRNRPAGGADFSMWFPDGGPRRTCGRRVSE